MIIDLANKADTYYFTRGIALRMRRNGEVVRVTRLWRAWQRLTAPFRKRCVVVDVNQDAGTITTAPDPKWYRFLN